jgi:putative transposase
MPRKPREEVAGGIHHVWARGNNRAEIYGDDADRTLYLHLLGRYVAKKRWRCLAYCLMDNHVHLLVETPEPNLGEGMQAFHSLYAQTYNERHARSGHVFQGRYDAKLVTDDAQLWTVVRYIARNPVEAGLSATPAAWAWSSDAAVRGGDAPGWLDRDRLLSFFGTMGGGPERTYRRFVDG